MASYTFTIIGEPTSKANSRRMVAHRGRLRPIKSAKAIAYLEAVQMQSPALSIAGKIRFTATLYYASERPDLDASLLLDGLQGKTYKNDRQVRELHLYHAIDRKNPRAEVTLEEMT